MFAVIFKLYKASPNKRTFASLSRMRGHDSSVCSSTLLVTMLPWQHFTVLVPCKLWKSAYKQHVPIGKFFITIYTNISFIVPTLSSLHTPSSIKIQSLNSFFPKTSKSLVSQEEIQIKADLGLNILKYFSFSKILL